jgi:hypothetical protein
MQGKIRVIKRSSVNSLKKEEATKVSSKENFKNWVAERQSGTKRKNLPSLKDLFPHEAPLEN